MAICLIVVMAFMWIKLLTKDAPVSAKADTSRNSSAAQDAEKNFNVRFIELPKIEGRNDVLLRDVFVVNGKELAQAGGLNIPSNGSYDDLSTRIGQKLRLEAIGMGENPQAFINGKLLEIDGSLTVKDGGQSYECRVVEIQENMVLLECEDVEIILRFASDVDVVN